LAQQIAEKEEITRALDIVKHLRLAELVELDVNGSDGAENSGSMAYSLGLDVDVSVQGKVSGWKNGEQIDLDFISVITAKY